MWWEGDGETGEKAENPWRMSIRAAPPRVRALFAPLLALVLLLQHREVISHFDAHQHAFFLATTTPFPPLACLLVLRSCFVRSFWQRRFIFHSFSLVQVLPLLLLPVVVEVLVLVNCWFATIFSDEDGRPISLSTAGFHENQLSLTCMKTEPFEIHMPRMPELFLLQYPSGS